VAEHPAHCRCPEKDCKSPRCPQLRSCRSITSIRRHDLGLGRTGSVSPSLWLPPSWIKSEAGRVVLRYLRGRRWRSSSSSSRSSPRLGCGVSSSALVPWCGRPPRWRWGLSRPSAPLPSPLANSRRGVLSRGVPSSGCGQGVGGQTKLGKC
jgi:hypothetical protein